VIETPRNPSESPLGLSPVRHVSHAVMKGETPETPLFLKGEKEGTDKPIRAGASRKSPPSRVSGLSACVFASGSSDLARKPPRELGAFARSRGLSAHPRVADPAHPGLVREVRNLSCGAAFAATLAPFLAIPRSEQRRHP
jgi:hypothetical protein